MAASFTIQHNKKINLETYYIGVYILKNIETVLLPSM